MLSRYKIKYLAISALMGAWGCSPNQQASRSNADYDDLYGGPSGVASLPTKKSVPSELDRYNNPDYQGTTDEKYAGTGDYYDENYISSRNINRAVSDNAGYNAGFVDGYSQASRFTSPYYGGMSSFWPGAVSFGIGMRFGGYGFSPYMNMGYGMGYSPFGYGMGYSPYSMMGMYDPFWGYSPYGYGSMYGMYGMGSMYGMGYNSFYGYGYNPWAYSSPVYIVNTGERQGYSRTYGPRVAGMSSRASNGRYNSSFVNSSRYNGGSTVNNGGTSDRGSRRGTAVSGDGYSSRSRGDASTRSANTYYSNGRSDASGYNSRSAASGTGSDANTYYSRPRSTNSGYTSGTSGAGTSSRSYSSDSYNSRSRSSYQPSTESRSYSSPARESYSAPQRTYSQPSQPTYSAPSRSYSAPSSGGGGGGGGHSSGSSRGPR